MIQNVTVTREYQDSATGGQSVIGVTVAYPDRVNKAALLMELGATFVDIVGKLTDSPEAEPGFSDLGFSGTVGDDLLFWALLGLPEKKDKFQAEKGDDDAHG